MRVGIVDLVIAVMTAVTAIWPVASMSQARESSVYPPLVGTWTYRSFINNPDIRLPFNDNRFGAGVLNFEDIKNGEIHGRISFGEQFQLRLRGWVTLGNPVTLRFQGVGERPGSDGWVYDYIGYYIPTWPNEIDQQPVIAGSVIRTVPHSNGQAPAGVVASWIGVLSSDAEALVGGMRKAVTETAASLGSAANQNPESQVLSNARKATMERLRTEWENLYREGVSPEIETLEERVVPAPQRLELAEAATTPFQEPDVIRSQNGELHATLVVKYANNQIGDDPVRLRSYNGNLVGPTLRARPGDTLRITIRNELPPEPMNGHDHNDHHGWNTTNLHTHGLHVSPSGNSDNVLLRIAPGESQDYEIRVPEDHPAGTFWYHAHKHGAVASQVSSGMAGALIIEGGIDEIPEIAAARERTLVLQQIPYWNESLSEGVIEIPFADRLFGPRSWDRLGRFTTVNGVQLPVIDMRPGEIQRWRLVNSGFREALLLKLVKAEDSQGPDQLLLNEIAVDGLALGRVDSKETIETWPGNRSDVLVQAPSISEGEYFLVDERTEQMDSLNGLPETRKYVAKVVIKGTPLTMALPRDVSLQNHRLPSIKPEEVTGTQTAVYGINVPPLTFGINGKAYDPNESRVLNLGDVDEWTLSSVNNVGAVHHPFHIHVNPFEVFSMVDPQGNERLGEPVWRDTIVIRSGWTVKFRTRYERFTGKFVQHCHILDHEDMGMMELIEIQ